MGIETGTDDLKFRSPAIMPGFDDTSNETKGFLPLPQA